MHSELIKKDSKNQFAKAAVNKNFTGKHKTAYSVAKLRSCRYAKYCKICKTKIQFCEILQDSVRFCKVR